MTCSWNTGADCDPKAKLDSTTACYAQECPTDSDIDWSGSGASSKEVFNEINTIPHGIHVPKSAIGLLRNPSKSDNNLNDIVEEDFSHYSHVEKSSENSVADNLPVDDFYYDYNFIKFHEDLSYDDGNDVFDNLGVKHGDLNVHGDLTSTSSPSTSADKHATTAVPSTTSKNAEGRDLLDENNEELFAEDYFLPVITTSDPSSAGTRLFNKWKASDFDLGLSQDFSTTRNPPTTPGTSHQPQDNHAYEAMPKDFLTLVTSDGNDRQNQKDKTKLTEDVSNEEEFGRDVPGSKSDWESIETSKPSLDAFWRTTASPASHPSERLSSTDGFANYESFTESTTYSENHEHEQWLTMTSDSLSRDFTPSATSSSSAKLYSSMTSAAGTTALPPTDVESHLGPLVTDATFGTETERSWATKAQDPTTEPWGTPIPHWTAIDNNEIKTTRIQTPVVLNPIFYTPTEQASQGTSNHPFSSLLVPSLSSPAYWRKGNWSAVSITHSSHSLDMNSALCHHHHSPLTPLLYI